jgi:hypothetical protein
MALSVATFSRRRKAFLTFNLNAKANDGNSVIEKLFLTCPADCDVIPGKRPFFSGQ